MTEGADAPSGPAQARAPGFSAATVRAAYDAVADDYAAAFADDLALLPLDRAMLDRVVARSPMKLTHNGSTCLLATFAKAAAPGRSRPLAAGLRPYDQAQPMPCRTN